MRQRPLTIASVLGLALASSAGAGSYTLRGGDTLGTVAHNLHVSVGALAGANHIADPDRVAAGQVLTVPNASAGGTTPRPGSTLTTGPAKPALVVPSGTYVVARGDTLDGIASRLGVTTAALVKANRIPKRDVLALGQKLLVPAGGSSGTKSTLPAAVAAPKVPARPRTYVVAPGDTLGVIGRRLGLGADTLAAANRIKTTGTLFTGQILTVPGGTDPAPVTAKPGSATGVTLSMAPIASVRVVVAGLVPTYVVVAKDTAAKIAAAHNTSINGLRKVNPGVSLDKLVPGTVLTVPGQPAWLCPVRGTTSFVDTWGAPREGGTVHKGTDIFARRGTPVVASLGGTLELRHGSIGGNAYYLYADDGNTYYGAHLDSVTAGPGRIAAGQQIGTVGDTGDAKGTPTHLHFELHPGGGNAVDPFFTVETWC